MNTAASDATAEDEHLPRAGSDFYYAALYHAPALRTEMMVLEGLRRAICRIPETCSDRGVAHIKLAWWRDELTRGDGEPPRHGLSRALVACSTDSSRLRQVCLDLLDATDGSLMPQSFADRDAVVAYLRTTLKPLINHIVQRVATEPALAPATDTLLLDLAAQTELAILLRDLRHHRNAATVLLPADALTRHGLSLDALRVGTRQQALGALLEGEFAAIEAALTMHLTALSRAQRREQRLLTSLARMQLAAIRLTLADQCQVLRRRHDLTPVHKLAIAWRCRWFG